jgi:hypothetical protein
MRLNTATLFNGTLLGLAIIMGITLVVGNVMNFEFQKEWRERANIGREERKILLMHDSIQNKKLDAILKWQINTSVLKLDSLTKK